jgi:hypothetical protein
MSTKKMRVKGMEHSGPGNIASSTPPPPPMIFLSWNCRGFSSKIKSKALKYLKGMVNPSIILLQETKMEEKSILEATSKL